MGMRKIDFVAAKKKRIFYFLGLTGGRRERKGRGTLEHLDGEGGRLLKIALDLGKRRRRGGILVVAWRKRGGNLLAGYPCQKKG